MPRLETKLRRARDDFAHRAPHASAHEAKVHGGYDDGQAVYRSRSVQRPLASLRLVPRLGESIGVGFGVHKGECVNRLDVLAQVREGAGIEQLSQPLLDGKAKVVVALGTNLE